MPIAVQAPLCNMLMLARVDAQQFLLRSECNVFTRAVAIKVPQGFRLWRLQEVDHCQPVIGGLRGQRNGDNMRSASGEDLRERGGDGDSELHDG